MSPLLLFFFFFLGGGGYSYKESNRYKYSMIQCYKSAIGNLVKGTPDNTCTPTIIEVQLRISEKVQATLYTNSFDEIIKEFYIQYNCNPLPDYIWKPHLWASSKYSHV